MAKIVWKTTPKAAYEWVEVDGGATMTDLERKALLDEFIDENGLVPVETTFVGEVPKHLYGRYKAAFSVAAALPPALPGREGDLTKANADLTAANAEIARLTAQLGKQNDKAGAEVVTGNALAGAVDTSTGGAQTTDAARAVLASAGIEIASSGERADLDTADQSTDEPERPRRGRPPKEA